VKETLKSAKNWVKLQARWLIVLRALFILFYLAFEMLVSHDGHKLLFILLYW